ncbi:MAG: serine protease Do [Blastocatellia bacterium]|jgi:membrane-associated protease RseP (regulator of RpoE activity)|nr:serine protease Do [Blastocatellia bacterium]
MSSDELNQANNSGNQSGTHCSTCGAVMPPDLRFCRACGSRLGEDVAEYTETVRFQNAPTANSVPPSAPGFGAGPQGPQAFGAVAAAPMQWTHKKKRKFSGMTWLFIGLLLFFVAAGVFTTVVKQVRPGGMSSVASAPLSFIGVDNFKDIEGGGGVTFNNVDTPDAPADKAGLIGGDVITSFDGHAVTRRSEMIDLMRQTPVGKPVEVIYLRDGEVKKTTLALITREQGNQLERAFARRPEGRGRFGYDPGDAERVLVPGTATYGVQLGEISSSMPADMAGIKPGDIIVEFDKVPIRTPGELKTRILRAKPYETINIVLIRDGQRLEFAVKMGKE